MTSALATPSTPNPTIKLSTDSMDFRSETIAKLASRTSEIATDTIRQLLSPHKSRHETAMDPLVPLMTELLKATCANEPDASNETEERDLAISSGLAVSLRWLYEHEPVFGERLSARLILKTLMPLYLSAGQGRMGSGIAETFSLIRTTCMIAELDRLTTGAEFTEWLQEDCRSHCDPFESIPKAFRIDLSRMSKIFWTSVRARPVGTNGDAPKITDPTTLAREKHRAWWSLAGQLISQRAQITVPAELAIGVIAWKKLSDHWLIVSKTLAGNSAAIATCVGAIGSDSEETLVDTTTNEKAASADQSSSKVLLVKDNQKCHIENDNRFVEIRSARDPQLKSSLDHLLQQCRHESGTLSLIVVKKLASGADSTSLQNWQATFIRYMDTHGEASNVRGFVSDEGELSLVFQDVEKTELAQWIRDSFAKFNSSNTNSTLATSVAQPLVAGVATVNAPSRSFKIDQLIQAAWRCLEGASTQGAGAVKTIEVY
jgi:hypothetical protein